MFKYICFSSGKELFNSKGESIGISDARALYYAKNIGKRRICRNDYPLMPCMLNGVDINSNLKLFAFKSPKYAQKLCDEINKVYDDDFKVKKILIEEPDYENENVISNQELYSKAVSRCKRFGILDATSIIVALEKEIDYYRATLEKYHELLERRNVKKEELKEIISNIAISSDISDFELFRNHFTTRTNIFELFFDRYFEVTEGIQCSHDKASYVSKKIEKYLNTGKNEILRQTYGEYQKAGGNIGSITELDEICYWCPKTIKDSKEATTILFHYLHMDRSYFENMYKEVLIEKKVKYVGNE